MIYQISSGQGPAECELAVAKFLEYLHNHYDISVVETSAGCHNGDFRSVRFFSEKDLSCYIGSIQWICQSPYRPNHKRKNWFIDFEICPIVLTEKFEPEQVIFETFHSGGKGGQNVNKVETGVRAIYLPTGDAVVCMEERSQYANKKKALARLEAGFNQEQKKRNDQAKNNCWKFHTQIVRGNAGVCFKGMDFKLESVIS